MSRIGKKEITIPSGTEVLVAGNEITIKGKVGTLKKILHPAIIIAVEGGNVKVNPANSSRLAQALWGTYAAHVRNMIQGVNQPFEKKLQVEGVGFRAEISGTTLKLTIGFSHPVVVNVPEGLTVSIDKNIISVSGPNKEQVGEFSATVRAMKKPEPYKGKGIRYEGEVVRQKQGKKVAA